MPAQQPAQDHDPACDLAHGDVAQGEHDDRRLLLVYASPLADYLAHWGEELGFAVTLLEPDPSLVTPALTSSTERVTARADGSLVDADTDVVVTDHHRDDLGAVLAPLVTASPRWIGIIGSPRHVGPHHAALAAQGVPDELIATVRRPIGADIGSKTPPEIALSVLAGLLADRNGRSGAVPQPPTAAVSR